MIRSRRTERGLTVLELIVSTSIAVGVLVGAMALVDASRGLAQSSNDIGIAATRVDRVIQPIADAIRHGSLASMRHRDGSNFSDGSNDTGFQVRTVLGFSGTPQTAPLVTYRFDVPSGAAEGVVLRAEGAFEQVLARGITGFTVSRTGTVFTIDVTARSGHPDDRGRVVSGTIRVAARNP